MQNEDGLSPFWNTHAERVPPFALVKPTGVFDAQGRMFVTRPDKDSETGLWVNSEVSVEPNAGGGAYLSLKSTVSYDTSEGIPIPGEDRGSKAGSWYAHKGQSGFKCIAGKDGIMNAVRVAPTAVVCCGWSSDYPSSLNDGGDGGGGGSESFALPDPITGFDWAVVKSTILTIPAGIGRVRVDGNIELRFKNLVVPFSTTPGAISYGWQSVYAVVVAVDATGTPLAGYGNVRAVVCAQWSGSSDGGAPGFELYGDLEDGSSGSPSTIIVLEGDVDPNFHASLSGSWVDNKGFGPLHLTHTDPVNPLRLAWQIGLYGGLGVQVASAEVEVWGLGGGDTALVYEKVCCERDAVDPPPP